MYGKRALRLLWLIREFGPISVKEVYALAQHNVPPLVEGKLMTSIIGMSVHVDLPNLIQAGLVSVQGDDPFSNTSLLTTTNSLALIQDIFGISLSDEIRHDSIGIRAYPIFDLEQERYKDHSWARIFVAMPFTSELSLIYSDHILKVTKALDISCERGDDHFTTSAIMNDIWRAIYHSDLCIVDCTGKNPNVFYELGIAHTLGRKTILITQNPEDIPFDIRHIRHIQYEYTPRGMEEFESRLTKTLLRELDRNDH